MKRKLLVLAIVLVMALPAGCVDPDEFLQGIGNKDDISSVSTESDVSSDIVSTTTSTIAKHSELYIPGLDVEDVIIYFNEVCLDSEFSTGSGDPAVIQKWTDPIYYSIEGDYTEEDIATLEKFQGWLNAMDHFPGIHREINGNANLKITFCSQSEMKDLIGNNYGDLDGYVSYWYDEHNRIYDEIIYYRTDIDQHLRNSVIIEEIYNGLGPVQDTSLRSDSIAWQEFSQPQWMSPEDELILNLLYHPSIRLGMNAEECEQVIRQLYY